MQVYKFGGATIKDAKAIEHIPFILERAGGPLVVVISAMNKTTNALERAVASYMEGDVEKAAEELGNIKRLHLTVATALIPDPDHPIYTELESVFAGLANRLKTRPVSSYNQEYDQVVCWGEILSTLIVSHYLNYRRISNQWIDARQILKTDGTFREGRVEWDMSTRLVRQAMDFGKSGLYITQGFIASTVHNLSTTLGREGSDYTAAILAHILEAESVTV